MRSSFLICTYSQDFLFRLYLRSVILHRCFFACSLLSSLCLVEICLMRGFVILCLRLLGQQFGAYFHHEICEAVEPVLKPSIHCIGRRLDSLLWPLILRVLHLYLVILCFNWLFILVSFLFVIGDLQGSCMIFCEDLWFGLLRSVLAIDRSSTTLLPHLRVDCL